MSRKCDACNREASQISDVFYDIAYSDNGDWYPEYTATVLCRDCFVLWVFGGNLNKLIIAQRITDPVKG